MLNNFTKTFINQMARRTGTILTEKHKRILEFAYSYYSKHGVGPLSMNFKRYTGVSASEINDLFPNGINSIYTWVGIPIQSVNDLCKPIANVKVKNKREIYFDHNATTYIRPEVSKVLNNYYSGKYGFGNPSSSTTPGKIAFDQITKSRRLIADCIKVRPDEITFTASGSEANNMAVKGIAFQYIETKGHIITSQIEHPSILEAIQFLGMFNFEVTFLDTDENGVISAEAVKKALRSDTILVAIMAVNNEIGTINPIEEIGEICRLMEIPFMVDAIQAFGKIPLRPKEMGISLMSFSAHKIYGPKGVGALYVDEMLSLVPLIHGGEQEFHRRAGTENVGHIIAFGRAANLAHTEMAREAERLKKLQDYFLEKLKSKFPDHIINGSMDNRVSMNLSVGFPNIDSGALLISLNKIGVYVSAGSACSAGSKEASPVIKALGVNTEKYGILRFSFGLKSKKKDVDYLFRYLPEIVSQLKED